MRSRAILILSALLLSPGLLLSGAAGAAVAIGISINVAPPELPVYEQPPIPAPGYLWSPGYWAWGDTDYYWVPGTWVQAPQPGYLWTPGYWGWNNGVYLWNGGYWGPHIGFYGGVNYGFGYGGSGYAGGEWRGGTFFYNRSVNNVANNTQITNVYNKTVVNNVTVNRVSFNGGAGGVAARPTAEEQVAAHEQHLPPVADQVKHEQVARANPALRAAANHGAPPIAATAHAGALTGAGVVGAHGAAAVAPAATHMGPVHPGPPAPGPVHPATGPPAGAGAAHPQQKAAPERPERPEPEHKEEH